LAAGAWWHEPLEATIGATVASEGGLGIGDSFAGAHGMASGGARHAETPYRVVGVMAPTGTVLDRLILTSIERVWDVHAIHDDEADARHDAEPASGGVLTHGDPDKEVTALLVKFRNPIAAAQLPRQINMLTPMQAALPGYEVARLMKLIGAGVDGFRAFAVVLVISAGLGIFTALYNALAQRRYDIAVMRALGATRGAILRQILLEGVLLALVGALLGLLLGHGTAALAGRWLREEHQVHLVGLTWVAEEFWLIVMAVALGALAALLPALQAYRIDISKVLARG
jgi:putative ABC transport system permease protein